MSVRVPAMSVFPPVRKDRVITQLPLVTSTVKMNLSVPKPFIASHLFSSLLQYYRKEAALHRKEDFNNKVKTACQEQRTGTVG